MYLYVCTHLPKINRVAMHHRRQIDEGFFRVSVTSTQISETTWNPTSKDTDFL